ncbi:protein of unknown function [Latilactobacillus sakei]|nr:hypothetical protein LSAJ160_90017 [Latilactobacillus sakei]SOB42167.1 hypothetical protein LSAJ112_100016 [Latilactobacillus sakei]SON64693.1 protein of unknown function [Latilactobacillus sakei]SON72704.1 protein of unknown function [Latilactobacillus sakei]
MNPLFYFACMFIKLILYGILARPRRSRNFTIVDKQIDPS